MDNYSGPQSLPPRTVSIRLPQVSPVVVYALLGLTIFVFVLQYASQYIYGVDYPSLLGRKSNELIIQGQLWRLFTPMFLHGGLLHIGFNMYALYIFGPGLERHFGHGRFLALYLLSGFAGNVLSFLFSPNPSLGSSTAIFGLLGAEGVFLYRNREIFGKGAQRALINIISVAAINLFIGLSPGIDNWGHMGGLIGGTLFAWMGGPLLKVDPLAMRVEDEREPGAVLVAGITVGALFALIAAAIIYFRS
jgi:rhomboid protease GluP